MGRSFFSLLLLSAFALLLGCQKTPEASVEQPERLLGDRSLTIDSLLLSAPQASVEKVTLPGGKELLGPPRIVSGSEELRGDRKKLRKGGGY